jgi:hypothetical protein
MEFVPEKTPPCAENTRYSAEPVILTGDQLLQKAHHVSKKIEERIRNVLREDEDSPPRD